MRGPSSAIAILVAFYATASIVSAVEPAPAPEAMRAAIAKAIPLIEKASAGSAEQRQCFTCHHQAVPVFALVAARDRGFDIDQSNLQRQVQHTAAHLERGREGYLQGRGQGGMALTAGYALWTLAAAGQVPDDTTAAVTHFLLQHQKEAEHWSHPGSRPPSSGSDFTTTYVALRGLVEFGSEEQAPAIAARTEQIGRWMRATPAADTEDRVFRLWTLSYLECGEEEIEGAVADLIGAQRDDGGWAQDADMQSDAYATATVLAALLDRDSTLAEHPAVRRGLRYLIDTQCDDGSWHVVTRADGFQTYFETGFPHGEDQFISMAASSWATLALLTSLPDSSRP